MKVPLTFSVWRQLLILVAFFFPTWDEQCDLLTFKNSFGKERWHSIRRNTSACPLMRTLSPLLNLILSPEHYFIHHKYESTFSDRVQCCPLLPLPWVLFESVTKASSDNRANNTAVQHWEDGWAMWIAKAQCSTALLSCLKGHVTTRGSLVSCCDQAQVCTAI